MTDVIPRRAGTREGRMVILEITKFVAVIVIILSPLYVIYGSRG